MTNHGAKKKKKKTVFLIVSSGIAVIVCLLFFFSLKTSDRKENVSSNEPKKNNTNPKPISQEENDNCPYLNEYAMTVSRKVAKDFIIKLWKKGYHWSDIAKFWDWGLAEESIPNRNVEKRTGIIKYLGVIENISNPSPNHFVVNLSKGLCSDLVIILRTISSGGPKINIDGSVAEIIEEKDSGRSKSTTNYIKKLINFALSQENINPQQCEISLSLPRGAENTGKELETSHATIGKSFGSAIYLALLSALHKKPLSNKIAATGYVSVKEKKGTIRGKEINLAKGTNLPIAGLKAKTTAASEKGVNCLVVSKYNCSPYLLSLKSKKDPFWGIFDYPETSGITEDYYQEVPEEIREKMNIHPTENFSELRELLLKGKLS